MMKTTNHRRTAVFLILLSSIYTYQSGEATQRKIHVSYSERDGENHIKMRVQAYEDESGKKYPLTTLTKESFEVVLNGDTKSKTQFSMQSFSSDRRSNGRAIVWIYDGTGVKTVRGLTRSLRTLTSQDFPNFTADATSIFGVARGKTIERGSVDSRRTDSTLSLQKKLSGNPKGLKAGDVTTEPSLCAALSKFNDWNRYGLKSSDQKVIFMLGGSDTHSSEYKAKQNDCVQKLSQMNVSIHQIVFASEERLQPRIWVNNEQIIKNGSLFRVIDIAGASRALATLQSLLDSEYQMSVQLPSESASLAHQVVVKGYYHGDKFTSGSFIIPAVKPTSRIQSSQTAKPKKPSAIPPQLVSIQNATQFALEGWIEWLLMSFLIGIVVTIRHISRVRSNLYLYPDSTNDTDNVSLPHLLVLSGKDRGKLIEIDKVSCILGRSWKCDVRLRARGVLRKHGRIEISGEKAIVEDFSHGQLLVNGRSIRKVRAIGHGSVIQLGELQLLFQCGES